MCRSGRRSGREHSFSRAVADQLCFCDSPRTGGDASACEHEARVFVARQRERRGAEALNVVAVFAAIQVRRGGELILMLVTMAI